MAQWRNSMAGELSVRSPTLCPPDLEKGLLGWAMLGRLGYAGPDLPDLSPVR